MAIFGISCGYHDAAVSVISGNKILFAAHAERYSRVKNDPLLNSMLVNEALSWGEPDTVVYYESPLLKKTRRWYAKQPNDFNPKKHIRDFFGNVSIECIPHHESHVAAGFYTSGFEDAAVIVADAIGEWDTTSVWRACDNRFSKQWSSWYPNSLGLLYSAFTKRCGFKPNEEEYIMMGAAAYGTPKYTQEIYRDFLERDGHDFKLKKNVHQGIGAWMPTAKIEDLAASIQKVLEDYLIELFEWTAYTTKMKNLVFMGGVALNCVANAKLAIRKIFDDIWIMPNPGDAGSSLGAALAYSGKHAQWEGPYLGTNIQRPLEIEDAIHALNQGQVIAVANGRAEFGPRALGNRSILADPRHRNTRQVVNNIKQREKFRPFAASVLEEHVNDWFVLPSHITTSPYMQYTWRVKQPRALPGICHADSTSRIQTVSWKQNPAFYSLLKEWHNKTGCPVLLNTSMNVKGMPLVNTWYDACEFRDVYGIPVF